MTTNRAVCPQCGRWLTTIATMITGYCERCLLPETARKECPLLFAEYDAAVRAEKEKLTRPRRRSRQ